jgi:hypothetical protein
MGWPYLLLSSVFRYSSPVQVCVPNAYAGGVVLEGMAFRLATTALT